MGLKNLVENKKKTTQTKKGLRELAEAKRESKPLPKMGLKELAEAKKKQRHQESDNSPLFIKSENIFSDFIKEINIEKAGFLISQNDENYTLSFPYGLNLTSFHRMVIPKNTLDKIIDKDKSWLEISNDDFKLFRNFFASQEYLSITNIILYSLKDSSEFLILIKSLKDINRNKFDFDLANKKLKEFIPNYINYKNIYFNAKPVYPFQKGKNTIALKINSALNENIATLFSISFNAIFPDNTELQTNINSLRLYYSIVNKIMNIVGKSNILILKNHLSICLFSKAIIPIDIYKNQIISELTIAYGKELCEKLIFKKQGTSKNMEEILNFLDIE